MNKETRRTRTERVRTMTMFIATSTLLLALALALISCKPDDDGGDSCTCPVKAHLAQGQTCDCGGKGCDCTVETPHEPQPATITQATTPALAFAGTVTITTGDLYLDADWNAVVAQVVAAFNAAYTAAPYKGDFDTVFGHGAQIVLVNNLATNWKTEPGATYGTLYIKISSINSISQASYEGAAESMLYNNSSHSMTSYATVSVTRIA